MRRNVRKPDDEWVVYRDKIKRVIEDGRYLIFTLVAHTWDFLPDADGEKYYTCYIREYEDDDDSLVNEYWRGFEISEEVWKQQYEQHADYFETFEKGLELLGSQNGFALDSQTKQKYEEFIEEFCSDIHCRDKYNLRHDFIYNISYGIDTRLNNAIIILNEIGVKTHCSCQGTDERWTDYPHPKEAHSVLAYIYVNNISTQIIASIKKDKRLRYRENCISTVKRKYNKFFSEILTDAIEEAYPGSSSIPQEIFVKYGSYVLEQGCGG